MLSVGSVAVTLGIIFVLNSNAVLLSGSSPPTKKYSVIIDAGSSGTRVHVFENLLDDSGKPVFDFGNGHYYAKKVEPGLSASPINLNKVTESVADLVKFAKEKIPQPIWEKSDIRLMGTGGMRLLPDEGDEERILNAARGVLRSSGFIFQDDWASVIPGSDEGKYAWVIANYAPGLLGRDPKETKGIVELGGASAQVAFVPTKRVPDPRDLLEFKYGGVEYKLYSHSFLEFGKDAALKMLLDSLYESDPCTPRGYNYSEDSLYYSSGFLADESKLKGFLKPAGNFEACQEATIKMLQKGKDTSCKFSINTTCTPELEGSFLATSNFYFTAKFFGLEEDKDWLSKLIPKGEIYCNKTWSALKREYPETNPEYLRGYCFSAAYIISMLHDSLGVAYKDESIRPAIKAGENNIPLDWALGAFILNTVQQRPANYGGNSRKILGF